MAFKYQQLHPQVKNLLETFLQRAEQPERQRMVRIHISTHGHPWYFSRDEPGLRARVHEELVWLEQQGWLKLRWQKYEVGNELAAIELRADVNNTLDVFSAFCGREPRHQQEQMLRQLLGSQQPAAAWFEVFLTHTLELLSTHRSSAPLSLSTPENNRDLLCALDALSRLHAPTLERTLSVQLFGDSKRLEELRPQILSVLRVYSPHISATHDDDWEILRAHFLHRPQIYSLMVGPLILAPSIDSLESQRSTLVPQGSYQTPSDVSTIISASSPAFLDLGIVPTGLGLPDELLRTAQIQQCTASAIVTVENQTSFHELMLARPAPLLIIFSNGFPHPTLLTFLQRLQSTYPTLPLFHWGDLDAGGLRILLHLRRTLGLIRPLSMDQQTFENYRSAARPLSPSDHDQLRDLLAEPLLSDCEPLIKQMLATNHKLEQEAIEIAYTLRQLSLD